MDTISNEAIDGLSVLVDDIDIEDVADLIDDWRDNDSNYSDSNDSNSDSIKKYNESMEELAKSDGNEKNLSIKDLREWDLNLIKDLNTIKLMNILKLTGWIWTFKFKDWAVLTFKYNIEDTEKFTKTKVKNFLWLIQSMYLNQYTQDNVGITSSILRQEFGYSKTSDTNELVAKKLSNYWLEWFDFGVDNTANLEFHILPNTKLDINTTLLGEAIGEVGITVNGYAISSKNDLSSDTINGIIGVFNTLQPKIVKYNNDDLSGISDVELGQIKAIIKNEKFLVMPDGSVYYKVPDSSNNYISMNRNFGSLNKDNVSFHFGNIEIPEIDKYKFNLWSDVFETDEHISTRNWLDKLNKMFDIDNINNIKKYLTLNSDSNLVVTWYVSLLWDWTNDGGGDKDNHNNLDSIQLENFSVGDNNILTDIPLSYRRALSIKDFLVWKGIDESRIIVKDGGGSTIINKWYDKSNQRTTIIMEKNN